MLTRLLALLALLIAAPAVADVSVSSPGGVLKVTIAAGGEGRVQYRVDRLGKPVIADSQLGFLFTDQPQFLRNWSISSSSTSDRSQDSATRCRCRPGRRCAR